MDQKPSRWWLFDLLIGAIIMAGIIWYLFDPLPLRRSDTLTPTAPADPVLNADLTVSIPPTPGTVSRRSEAAFATLIPNDSTARFGLPCGLDLRAEARPLANILVQISDPCRPDSRMVVRHAGLAFTVTTDVLGVARVSLPALDSPAEVVIEHSSGDRQSVRTEVPDLDAYHRVGVYWRGHDGLALHAIEMGDRMRLVTPDTPSQPVQTHRGLGGHITLLGDSTQSDPILAQVYTAPSDPANQLSHVRFDLQVQSPDACESQITGGTVQLGAHGELSRLGLEIALEDCGSAQDVVVLRNIFRDLTLGSG